MKFRALLAACRSFSTTQAVRTGSLAVSEAVANEVPPLYVAVSNLITPPAGHQEQVAVLDRSVFAHPIRRDVLHLCINYYRDNLRQGTAHTKTRGEVRGSGAKIRPQKGTGRARLGDGQSPMLRGGGVAFGPRPRSFATSLPRKVRLMGMKVALSAKLRERGIGIVESLNWPGFKTKEFAQRMGDLGWDRTLFVTGRTCIPEKLARASGNIQGVDILLVKQLNVYDILRSPRIVLDTKAVEYLERLLGKDVPDNLRIAPPREQSLRFSRVRAGRFKLKRNRRAARIEAQKMFGSW